MESIIRYVGAATPPKLNAHPPTRWITIPMITQKINENISIIIDFLQITKVKNNIVCKETLIWD